MAGIRQKGTKIETMVAAVLRDLGLHYRKNIKSLAGSPDFASRWAVFVHGCFGIITPAAGKRPYPNPTLSFGRQNFARISAGTHARPVLCDAQGYRVVVIREYQKDRIRDKLSNILETRSVDAG